ncbi:MAG: DUF4230 domain-containing protein [Prevotellaceae bacterium]|jgi:hypothetical protein|nr:DUF4230 domain-containing protein [Prevotellaceae bacterium]
MRPFPLNIIPIIIKAAAIVLIIAVAILILNNLRKKHDAVEIHQSVVEKVEAIGKLSLVKMTLQDIVEYTKVREWLPDASALLVVQGEIEAGIDLAKITEKDIRVNGNEITVYLPTAEITSFKINHTKSRVYDTRNNFFSGAQIVDAAYNKAEKQIYAAALRSGILQIAEENAIKFLTPLFQTMGFSKINLRFGKTTETINNE